MSRPIGLIPKEMTSHQIGSHHVNRLETSQTSQAALSRPEHRTNSGLGRKGRMPDSHRERGLPSSICTASPRALEGQGHPSSLRPLFNPPQFSKNRSTSAAAAAVAAGGVVGLPVEAVVDAVDGVHGLRVQGHEFALVLLDRRLLLVCSTSSHHTRKREIDARERERKKQKQESAIMYTPSAGVFSFFLTRQRRH